MSIPRQNTIFGKVLFEEQNFGLLERKHLHEDIENTIDLFQSGRRPFAHSLTAPWTNNQPQWKIEDGKLYLTGIDFSVDISEKYKVRYGGEERIETVKTKNGERSALKIGRSQIILPNDHRSSMQKLFGSEKIFAHWVNEPMKLLVKESQPKPVLINEGKPDEKVRYMVTMDLLILKFRHGILIGREKQQTTYFTIKNHIADYN